MEKMMTLRSMNSTVSVKGIVEDENTVSVDAFDFMEFQERHFQRAYIIAVIDRKAGRYNFGGITDGKAFFSKNL